jgi:hypothetical protein
MKKPNRRPINVESGDILSFFVYTNDLVELVSVSTGNEAKFIVLTDRDKININKKFFIVFKFFENINIV